MLVLIPDAPPVTLMVLSSVLNGLLLPLVLVFALSIINNERITGDFIHSKWHNCISWTAVVTLIVPITALIVMTVLPKII